MKEKISAVRLIKYFAGMIVLATGLAMTAQTGLGTTPLTAIAFVLSDWSGWRLADMVLVMFTLFTLAEVVMSKDKSKKAILLILLQLPVSIVFTRIMRLVQPMMDFSALGLWWRVFFLLFSVVLTGVGAAMMLETRLIVVPGDGIVRMIADNTGKPLGGVKNIFDISNVAAAAVISLLVLRRLSGVGVGSVVTMLGVGRVIALYNKLFLKKSNAA